MSADEEIAAARAEYAKHWTASPDESIADLMRNACDAAEAETARFKARGAELDVKDEEIARLRAAINAYILTTEGSEEEYAAECDLFRAVGRSLRGDAPSHDTNRTGRDRGGVRQADARRNRGRDD